MSTSPTPHLPSTLAHIFPARKTKACPISPFWCLLGPELAAEARSQGARTWAWIQHLLRSPPMPLTPHVYSPLCSALSPGLQKTQRGLGYCEGNAWRETDAQRQLNQAWCAPPGLGPSSGTWLRNQWPKFVGVTQQFPGR